MSSDARKLLVLGVASAALLSPGSARACDPVVPTPHSIDPAMVGVDQTPPMLQQPKVAEIRHYDRDEGCVTPKCGWDNGVTITNLATDDTTPADRIGYRVTVVAGGAPAALTTTGGSAILAAGGVLQLFWDGDADVDFTLELIAVDAAGNQSTPQMVRVHNDTGGCRVGRARADNLTLAIVAMALAAAMYRRPRWRR